MNGWLCLASRFALWGACLWGAGGVAVRAADPPEALLRAQQERVAAIHKAVQATVSVFARGGNGGGSGVVISPDGFALTNYHVVKPCGNFMKCSLPDGNLYDAVIVGIDPVGDVALIKLVGRDDFPVAEMADSDGVRVGDFCFAVGNPFLLATDFQPTVTWGIVSGTHRYQYPAGTLLEYTDCIQTDAAINPGNSGGPLFDAQGRLIGINGRGSFEKRGRVNVGVGYAISINQVRNFLGHLHSGRILDHATLGASASTTDDGMVTVANILETSDAYRRGLRYGNEILAFGDRPIRTVNAFKNVLGIYPKGWRVPLSYRRDGKRYDVHVRLAGVHSPSELLAKVEGGAQPRQRPMPEGPQPENPPGPMPPRPMPRPRPMPMPGEGAPPREAAVPPELAALFKARSGYSNFYFNEQNRERVWKAWQAHGDFAATAGEWKLVGELDEGGQVEISLGDKEALATLRGAIHKVDLAKDFDAQLLPLGSGGLLPALHLWQQLAVLGPRQYGDVYYLGTAPVVGKTGLFDVLVATRGAVETHFYFDPKSGELTGMEMWGDPLEDPCEIYFGDWREVNGRKLPHRLVVLHGDDVFGVVRVKEWNLPAKGEDRS